MLRKRGAVDNFVYWMQTQSRAYSPRSVQAYWDQSRLFMRWLDQQNLDITAVTRDDIINHFADLASTGHSQGTISLRHSTIRRVYDYLMEKGAVSSNPAREIPFRIVHKDSGEPYTQNEVRRMYQACRTWQERAVFMLLLGTGLRRSEVFRVSRDDCNFENGTIRILRKGGKFQYIQPEPAVLAAVETALEFNDRLCWQKCDDYVPRLIKRLAKQANIPGRHHPHRLRFTFAVQWCEMGGQESELMHALGHTSMAMTQYYSKVGRERRAMKAMQGMGIASRLLMEPAPLMSVQAV